MYHYCAEDTWLYILLSPGSLSPGWSLINVTKPGPSVIFYNSIIIKQIFVVASGKQYELIKSLLLWGGPRRMGNWVWFLMFFRVMSLGSLYYLKKNQKIPFNVRFVSQVDARKRWQHCSALSGLPVLIRMQFSNSVPDKATYSHFYTFISKPTWTAFIYKLTGDHL